MTSTPDLESLPTRERILEATLQVLDEDGDTGLRLVRVAELAGLTTGAIYGTFESREALIASAHVERLRRWTFDYVRRTSTSSVEHEDDPGVPPQERVLREILSPAGRSARLAWAASAAKAAFDPELERNLQPTEQEFLNYAVEQIKPMQEAGILRSDIDPRVIAAMRMAVAVGVALTSRVYDDDPEFTDKLIEAWPYVSAAFVNPGSTNPRP